MFHMEKIIKNRFIQHVLFWLFFMTVLRGNIIHEFHLQKSLLAILLYTFSFFTYFILVYSNLLIFLPRFYLKKMYLSFVAANFITACLLIVFAYRIIYFIDPLIQVQVRIVHWLFYNLFFGFSLLILSTFLHFIRKWSELNENNLKAQKEKISAELEALKAQINPHLLFNTLNNLYSLSLEKSDKLPGLILKLSELMNYILYDCKSDFVPLSNEIEFIKNYIILEKIRFEDSAVIQTEFDTNNASLEIAPLLLLPFIDNAFKHSQTIMEKRVISILLKTDGTILTFIVENNYEPDSKENHGTGGIGINNVKKRLEYIYPGKHIIDINSKDNIFKINLVLNLKQEK